MVIERVLGWIRRQAMGSRTMFSGCTGALLCGAAGLLNSGVIVCQLIGFGRLMHRIVEAVAKQSHLIPVESVARSPVPIRTPSPV